MARKRRSGPTDQQLDEIAKKELQQQQQEPEEDISLLRSVGSARGFTKVLRLGVHTSTFYTRERM